MKKKAQLFTLSAILIIMLFFISYDIYSSYQNGQNVRRRVKSMDNFLFSLEKNFEREAYISGFRILFLALDDISKNGKYIDVQEFFREAFFNGTVRGENKNIMEGARYSDFLENIQEKADIINLDVEIGDIDVEVYQDNPWEIIFSMNFSLSIIDSSGLASWDKIETIQGRIGIEGFEDPLYIVNTNGKVTYKINATRFEGNYANGINIQNLSLQLSSRYYSENTDAPSFLKRLEGNLSSDENGIESFVDLSAFAMQEIPAYDRSVVDHEYFKSAPGLHIRGMPSWFKLDVGHLAKYNCSEIVG